MKKHLKILIPLIICVIISSLFVYFGKISYNNIITPKFAPPSFIFIIMWTIIYLIFYFTMIKIEDTRLYTLYIIILILQTLWNLIFFGLGAFLLSLLVMFILYFVSFVYVYYFSKINKKYFYIYLVYLIWLLIASYLNIGIYILN